MSSFCPKVLEKKTQPEEFVIETWVIATGRLCNVRLISQRFFIYESGRGSKKQSDRTRCIVHAGFKTSADLGGPALRCNTRRNRRSTRSRWWWSGCWSRQTKAQGSAAGSAAFLDKAANNAFTSTVPWLYFSFLMSWSLRFCECCICSMKGLWMAVFSSRVLYIPNCHCLEGKSGIQTRAEWDVHWSKVWPVSPHVF